MRRGPRDPATAAYRFAVDDDELHFCAVRIVTDRGNVVDYGVVYLATVAEKLMAVERYDIAHGYPHRDTLDWEGHVVQKHWIPLASFGAALDAAILDVKLHYQRYFDQFLARRPGR
jgi:hypothetical protein